MTEAPRRLPITKTTVLTDGALIICDTIEHAGELWLVPEWNHATHEGWMQPARIIRLTGLRVRETPGGTTDRVLQPKLPMSVLRGRDPSSEASGYLVVEAPDIRIVVGGVH